MSMSDIDKPLPNDAPNVTLTIRMIMNGKEVGSIIGKGGEIINTNREESGAKIHITDGTVQESIDLTKKAAQKHPKLTKTMSKAAKNCQRLRKIAYPFPPLAVSYTVPPL